MDQTLTGTVHGNTIVLDRPLLLSDGQAVEVVVRAPRTEIPGAIDSLETCPPAWWTSEDDRILAEIYRSRKGSTRPEIAE